jgi:hypothetical protein
MPPLRITRLNTIAKQQNVIEVIKPFNPKDECTFRHRKSNKTLNMFDALWILSTYLNDLSVVVGFDKINCVFFTMMKHIMISWKIAHYNRIHCERGLLMIGQDNQFVVLYEDY